MVGLQPYTCLFSSSTNDEVVYGLPNPTSCILNVSCVLFQQLLYCNLWIVRDVHSPYRLMRGVWRCVRILPASIQAPLIGNLIFCVLMMAVQWIGLLPCQFGYVSLRIFLGSIEISSVIFMNIFVGSIWQLSFYPCRSKFSPSVTIIRLLVVITTFVTSY